MGNACHVVIVDDEVLVRQGIKHLLQWEQEGFSIVGEAANGQEALKLIEQLQPHIVITDIVMPQMDGVELTSIIKERYPQIEVIVLSSFSEFHYVRDTFQKGVADYMLKPKLEAEQLLAILKRTAKRIPSLQLAAQEHAEQPSIHILLDRLMSGYELDEAAVELKQLFAYPSFRLFGADLKHGRTYATMREHLLQRVEEMLEPFLQHMDYYVLGTESNMLIILFNSSEGRWSSMIPAIRALANSVRYKEQQIAWVLGESFRGVEQLHEQVHEQFAKLAASRYFLPPDRTLIMKEELPKLLEPEPVFNMSEFMERMQQRKLDEAIEMINHYAEAASDCYTLDVFAFKSLLGNIIFNMIIMLGKLEINTKQLEAGKYHYFRSINESVHVTEATGQLQAFIEQAKETVKSSRFAAANPNLTMIVDYIHQYYMEPLSLSDVASHFHFNPSYLSTFLSSHLAEGFSEYLNRVRVDKAAELLQATDLAIADISVQVGYSDHSYFTKVFKKLKGMSPSQFRKSHIMQ